MKSLLFVLALSLCVAAPALAVDPPPYNQYNFTGLLFVEIDVLVVEVDNTFYGKVDLYGIERTYKLHQTTSLRNDAILQLLKDNVGEVVRLEGMEVQTYVRNIENEHGLILINAKVVE